MCREVLSLGSSVRGSVALSMLTHCGWSWTPVSGVCLDHDASGSRGLGGLNAEDLLAPQYS